MKEDIAQVMEAIAGDVLKLACIILEKNGLKDSNLYNDVRVNIRQTENPIVIETLFDSYIDYLEQGRKPMTGKQPPIDTLRDWALSRGIPADNSTLFLISRAIWRNGQQGRPILSVLEEEIEKAFEEEWSDRIFKAITDELTKYFN